MLSNRDLELFKICELPRESALIWIGRIKNKPDANEWPFDDSGYYLTGQHFDLGGDLVETAIYYHRPNGFYYLIVECLEGKQ